MSFNPATVPSPSYVVDLGALENNLRVLQDTAQRADCKILLALKGFALFHVFPLCRRYLAGTTASSLHEARLGREEFGGETHIFAPAFRDDEIDGILTHVNHICFNSFSQWRRHRDRVRNCGRTIACGLRINPEHSEVKTALYDPCAPGSRMGIPLAEFEGHEADLEGISGLHFHTLCELNSDALERTLTVVEERFGRWFKRLSWINFGGGHHITRADYDRDRLVRLIRDFRARHGLEVYLEPGEAVALNAGYLVATVLDLIRNGSVQIAILDTSAAAHMPDVLEMPYRPNILGAGTAGQYPHTYRLGAPTCLSGDVIGDYSFPSPLEIGQRLVFTDMAHYSMVKNNTFNGIRLPAIVTYDPADNRVHIVREFGYEDFRNRLS